MTTMLLNGLRAASVRLYMPWQGAWTADVDVDLSAVPVVPSGLVVLKIGDAVLSGAIDPDASGKFGVTTSASPTR